MENTAVCAPSTANCSSPVLGGRMVKVVFLQKEVGSDSVGSRFASNESVGLDQWGTFDLDG